MVLSLFAPCRGTSWALRDTINSVLSSVFEMSVPGAEGMPSHLMRLWLLSDSVDSRILPNSHSYKHTMDGELLIWQHDLLAERLPF